MEESRIDNAPGFNLAAAARDYPGGKRMILTVIIAALYLPLYIIAKLTKGYMK
jgi:hypothetical protein